MNPTLGREAESSAMDVSSGVRGLRVRDAIVIAVAEVGGGLAALTLRGALSCDTPAVRVSAARIILENSLKAVELTSLIERVEELERRAGKGEQP